MALPEQYLVTTKNLHSFLNSLLNAQAPSKFTNKFIEQLGYTSTNDRLMIGVLKLLGFIDQAGVPQQKYFDFLDQTESKYILATAIKEAYRDLFSINVKAFEMSLTEIKNKFRTLTQGAKSETVISLMANTFNSLCQYADFSKLSDKNVISITKEEETTDRKREDNNYAASHELINKNITTELHYNIQIHLPETRDASVYDAIFKSLKEHLL